MAPAADEVLDSPRLVDGLAPSGEDELRDVHPAGTVRPHANHWSSRGRFDHLTPIRRGLLLVVATLGTVVTVAGLLATAHGLQQMLWAVFDKR